MALSPSPAACRAAAQLGRTVDRALDDSELTPAAYRLLSYLSTGRTAATVLAEKLAVSRPTVTATTSWLVSRGLCTKRVDPDDGRRVAIEMTNRGVQALVKADKLVAERLVEVLDPVSTQSADVILNSLEQLLVALNRHREHSHHSRYGERPNVNTSSEIRRRSL